ncbi:MAG TPA: N-acyl homoserine lactonase family protein [Acidobacteriaceae bacterium]|nr:N-acyl homoserine lactonase family protein [Acidobacteriaceae bacterium]
MPRNVVLILLASLACAPLAAQARSTSAQTGAPIYTIEAIRYATIKDFPVNGLVTGADPSRKMDIAMVFWLVQGGGHNILFDSGFYRPQFFRDWAIVDYRKPTDAVRAAGLAPEDVTDIVISHMHWDHVDGMDLFPKARIWIQRDEYTYYTGDAWHHPDTHGGIDPDDVEAMVKANIAGRVSFVEGDDREILPGIRCYIGGKHTYQSQYITVPAKDGTVVLASDNVYLYENLDKHVPIAETLDAKSNLAAQDRMRTLASNPQFIIPGHDPAIFERFPAVAPGVVKID